MAYQVKLSNIALKNLKKIDKKQASLILGYIRKNLEGCENPRALGKPLVGNQKGIWRYRVGSYRILAEIKDSEIIIEIIEIGHRRNIYN